MRAYLCVLKTEVFYLGICQIQHLPFQVYIQNIINNLYWQIKIRESEKIVIFAQDY